MVTSAQVLELVVQTETLGNVGGLLLDADHNIAGFVVEAFARVIVANVLDGPSDDLLVIEVCFRGDLAEDHDQARLGGRLACHFGGGILGEAGVEDGIGDLVTDLVRVAFSDGLGGEEESVRLVAVNLMHLE